MGEVCAGDAAAPRVSNNPISRRESRNMAD
jgi:hypothetical protein